ncbi:DNA polymerase III subunit beta [Patescibacteria group bacterium]|nr:DNA polymerase III subunit beta [Patescibacteria group bacterium]MBU1868622.1 DNA polymerase III subunit beta [Patescibacteria group bacterium]
MKAICNQPKLAKALSQTSRLIPSRSELPILSNILVSTSSSSLNIYATNLQLSISTQIPAEVTEEGEITIPALPVQSYISSLLPQKVRIELKSNRLRVQSEKTEASFVTMDPVDYPSFPEKEKEPIIVFKTEELAKLIRKTRFAAATDESRPVLTGVLITITDNRTTFVATDGFRLSIAEGEVVRATTDKQRLIIPAAAFNEVEKLLGSVGENEVSLYLSTDKNQVIFDFVSVCLASRLLEAEYPDYEKILPSDFNISVTMAKKDLEQAVRTVSIFAQKGSQTIYFSFKDGKGIVEAQSSEVGEGKEEIVANIDGGELSIAFNSSFIREALEAFGQDQIVFTANDALSPTKWASPADKGFFHIIMPIRMEEGENA